MKKNPMYPAVNPATPSTIISTAIKRPNGKGSLKGSADRSSCAARVLDFACIRARTSPEFIDFTFLATDSGAPLPSPDAIFAFLRPKYSAKAQQARVIGIATVNNSR